MKMMQRECFPDELETLANGRTKNSLISKYNLFLDKNEIVRAQTRLENVSDFSYSVSNPILLGNHWISKLLIRKSHFVINDLGIESTLTDVRNSCYLLLNSRTLTKKVVLSCIVCNKYNSRAGHSPFPPNLPASRVNLVRPFYSTGIDFTGHFFVKDEKEKFKSYILIFS